MGAPFRPIVPSGRSEADKLNRMNRRTAIVAALAASGLAITAQRIPDFTSAMKACTAAERTLTKLDNKTGAAAVRSAERLGGIYEEMIEFWRQRNAPDAVKWSEQGKAAAVQLASAASAGNAEQAAAAFKTIDVTCSSCHEARRARLPDGTFTFKTPVRTREAKK